MQIRLITSVAVLLVLAGCGSQRTQEPAARSPAEVKAEIMRLLPTKAADPQGWATDIQVAFTAQDISPTTQNLCSVLAVTEQESTFQVDPSVPVVWVDTGYNLRDTYVVAEKLMSQLPLNMQIYTPRISAERWNAVYGGIPQLDDPELHESFTRNIKLEPFERAFRELQPELWLTGIRRGETEFRQTLDIVSWDTRWGLLRVAPIFAWNDADVAAYMEANALPSCRHYFDPTKVLENRECGLHTGL